MKIHEEWRYNSTFLDLGTRPRSASRLCRRPPPPKEPPVPSGQEAGWAPELVSSLRRILHCRQEVINQLIAVAPETIFIRAWPWFEFWMLIKAMTSYTQGNQTWVGRHLEIIVGIFLFTPLEYVIVPLRLP
jgi:hypothetical protein